MRNDQVNSGQKQIASVVPYKVVDIASEAIHEVGISHVSIDSRGIPHASIAEFASDHFILEQVEKGSDKVKGKGNNYYPVSLDVIDRILRYVPSETDLSVEGVPHILRRYSEKS